MLNQAAIEQRVREYHQSGQTLEAARFVLKEYGLEHPNLIGLGFQKGVKPGMILMTTVGSVPGPQEVFLPEGVFGYDFSLVLNLLMHEMLHVRQKAVENPVLDKNEREFQAYREMLFHQIFPQVPDAPLRHRIDFAHKALEYYRRMGEGSRLQSLYEDQAKELDGLLQDLNLALSRRDLQQPMV